jgi:hypothetical protein
MKIRQDFVTNSSSSSFIIAKSALTSEQIKMIHNHDEIGEELGLYCYDEPWAITETAHFIKGSTGMDNFDMSEFFEKIGIDNNLIEWGD